MPAAAWSSRTGGWASAVRSGRALDQGDGGGGAGLPAGRRSSRGSGRGLRRGAPAHCAEVVAELAAAGCGGAVVYSLGFAEAGPCGAARRRGLLAAAGSMPLFGPNCYGLVNYAARVLIWPDQHGGVGLPPGERGVAVVSQSSSIAISVTMADGGLPLHSVVAVGNGAQLGVAQVAEALLASEQVSAIGMIVESLADLRVWERLAVRARERRIGLVALVLGRSELARRAVVTHTASLAGDAEACALFLRRNGIGQVDVGRRAARRALSAALRRRLARHPADLAQQLWGTPQDAPRRCDFADRHRRRRPAGFCIPHATAGGDARLGGQIVEPGRLPAASGWCCPRWRSTPARGARGQRPLLGV